MSRSRYKIILGDESPYFITSTVVGWTPVFRNSEVAQIVLETLHYLQVNDQLVIFAYVVMENHIHLIVSSKDLQRIIARFRSFTARKCIDYFSDRDLQHTLRQLSIKKPTYGKDRKYQFWQQGIQPKQIQGREMMLQKARYIHENPVRKGYVDLPENWKYSSAQNYLGMGGLLEVCVDW